MPIPTWHSLSRFQSTAVAVNNAILLHRTRTMYSAAVRALAATVDIRDTYTMNHSENVSAIAGIIAAELGLPKEEIEVK